MRVKEDFEFQWTGHSNLGLLKEEKTKRFLHIFYLYRKIVAKIIELRTRDNREKDFFRVIVASLLQSFRVYFSEKVIKLKLKYTKL